MSKDELFHRDSTKSSTNFINLEDLFYSKRILVKPKVCKAILYFPFGLLLLLLRIVVCSLGLLVLSVLPTTSHTRSILKGMCKLMGLIVEVDDKYLDDTAKVLVANHVSILDRLAVNVMVPCKTISKELKIKSIESLWFWKDNSSYTRKLTYNEVSSLKSLIDASSVRILSFPEGSITNGKKGLLKFHPEIFDLNSAVQPVLVYVSMSSFMTVSPSTLSSTVCGDLLWAFFLPCTNFTLKVLPSVIKHPEESAEDYSNRVQEIMAKSLNCKSTVFTSSDKNELCKRLETSAAVVSTLKMTSKSKSSALRLQSEQEVVTVTKTQNLSMTTAAESFGKTPKQRMASYQERRAKLLEIAKIKYLQKQNNSPVI